VKKHFFCTSCRLVGELLERNKNVTLPRRLLRAAEVVTLNYWSATKM
jgi:hypothetical protein